MHEGKLYESTGLLGRSTLRRVMPATGAVEKSVRLASDVFGEGLALAGDRLFVLTWQNHVAFTYDLEFNQVGRFEYTGEGWGLCFDGERLVMSNGSSKLFFRNPETFAIIGEIEVRNTNGPIGNLNELECVGSFVYANVWQTETILRIDAASGDVLGAIDASGLLTPAEAMGTDVLNGIAFDPRTSHFFITGKLWPKVFEVRFPLERAPPSGGGGSTGASGGAGIGGVSPSDAGAGRSGAGASHPSGESGGANEPESPATQPSRSKSSCGCELPGEPGRARWTPWLLAVGALVLRRKFPRA
jgi:MYXO-CTERM domain-containing protein